MLKKIPVSSLRLGMHLHAMEGTWLNHALWRSKFTLVDDADRQAVVNSGVDECWIDVSKGVDVATELPIGGATTFVERAAAPQATPAVRVQASDEVPPQSTSFEAELQHAARLCKASKPVMQKLFQELREGKSFDPDSFRPMAEELAASVFRNRSALVNLVRLKSRDDYTYMHSVAVCTLMVALAREMGMGLQACRDAGLAGLLHDVGKALVPLRILNKPGKLTDDEFALMRTHPARGHALLVESGTASPAELDVCLHHHEHMDGTGYPEGLEGESISQLARMGAICDVYDAVTSARPYKAAWDPADALSRMASWAGHFDTKIFAVFVRCVGIYPSGSLVRLRSGKLAVVVHQHPVELTSPTVKVFFSTKANLPIPLALVDLARKDVNDPIVAREPRSNWNFPDLDAIWAGDAKSR